MDSTPLPRPRNSILTICPCSLPGHLLLSRHEVHVRSCPPQVIKSQHPGREVQEASACPSAPLHLCPPRGLSAGHTDAVPGPARGRSPCLAGFLPPFRPLAAASVPAKCLPNLGELDRLCSSQAALLFLESRQLSRPELLHGPGCCGLHADPGQECVGGMRLLRALVMNAFPPNWVREVIS